MKISDILTESQEADPNSQVAQQWIERTGFDDPVLVVPEMM